MKKKLFIVEGLELSGKSSLITALQDVYNTLENKNIPSITYMHDHPQEYKRGRALGMLSCIAQSDEDWVMEGSPYSESFYNKMLLSTNTNSVNDYTIFINTYFTNRKVILLYTYTNPSVLITRIFDNTNTNVDIKICEVMQNRLKDLNFSMNYDNKFLVDTTNCDITQIALNIYWAIKKGEDNGRY